MKTDNPNITIMKVILDEEKAQIKNFIRQSSADEIYDRLYVLCAFDLAYEILNHKDYMTDKTAAIIARHPSIMTDIMKQFSEEEDAEPTVASMVKIIDDVLSELSE